MAGTNDNGFVFTGYSYTDQSLIGDYGLPSDYPIDEEDNEDDEAEYQ